MRSSKSRSRNKSRNRSVGNIVNRVFDSSGPEGKVRGTPQQIIDKYNQLARDAQLSGDRVATENFQQHAEHYLRMLGEAQREQDNRREQQEQENRQRQAERDRERAQRQDRDGNTGGGEEKAEGGKPEAVETGGEGGKPEKSSRSRSRKPRGSGDDTVEAKPARRKKGGDDVIEMSGEDADSMLVETPENAADKPATRKRAPRKAPEAEASAEAPAAEGPEAVE
ncbi:protein of unknown function [Pseudooceanicola antarcticus]|uniref:DUF4167 domain-containing protein n=1 Tax=Pseudooceanicola antarcticus TaxID=1247613 RepID=A0A285IWC6_9RHOB|nr:DUF4167 domain-containing protein [Pseudooceanicola antarcticus]PJE25926.1 DUF4167 domain-containing protein [Pseudooceanicola antarcticus]SNY52345.1 protein of unknown function [Pseudooceanicola antarcticus]